MEKENRLVVVFRKSPYGPEFYCMGELLAETPSAFSVRTVKRGWFGRTKEVAAWLMKGEEFSGHYYEALTPTT